LNILYIFKFKLIPESANLPKDQLIPMPKQMPMKRRRSDPYEDDAEQREEQPPRKMTQTLCKGQKRDYFYQKTVNSIEELDKYRFEVFKKQI
jgi:hypothetical protein